METPFLTAKAEGVEFLLFDCDGVFTDGGVILGSGGQEFKLFNIQDGMGVSLARGAGLKVGIITGRKSEAVEKRAGELKMDVLIQGAKDKVAALDEACAAQGISREQAAYMGDDIQDLAILMACGLSLAPANARPDVRSRVDFVTEARGGHGAVREAIELVLRAKGLWKTQIRAYLEGATPP